MEEGKLKQEANTPLYGKGKGVGQQGSRGSPSHNPPRRQSELLSR